MAFLTIAGIQFQVGRDGPTELATESGGGSYRAWNGTLRTTARWEKRGWQFKSIPMLPAAVATFKAAIALHAQVACVGDFADGASVTCEVDYLDAPYLNGSGSPIGVYRVLTIRLREV